MKRALAGTAAAFAAAGAATAAWSLWEAQWVEFVEVDVPIEGLPPALDGFRILHLSDFHLGSVSLNRRSLEKALDWATGREYDVVAITGDLLARRRGGDALRDALARLRARHGVYAILGNHDIAETRDPFSQASDLSGVEHAGAVLLSSEERTLVVDGATVQLVGVDARAFVRGKSDPGERVDSGADLRILLCHFPDVVWSLPPRAFHLILAGHLHGGQICVPLPGRRLRLAHFRAPYWQGVHRTDAGVLCVSRGLGTTFVPFRFFARPDVTDLTLRTAH